MASVHIEWPPGRRSFVTSIRHLTCKNSAFHSCGLGCPDRVLNHLPGSREDNVRRIYEPCKRHADTVCNVVDAGISDHAPLLRAQQLPSTCLLSLDVSPIAKQPAYSDPMEHQPKACDQAKIEVSDSLSVPRVFAFDEKDRCVRFWGGIKVNVADYEFLKVLPDQFRHDLENGSDCKTSHF